MDRRVFNPDPKPGQWFCNTAMKDKKMTRKLLMFMHMVNHIELLDCIKSIEEMQKLFKSNEKLAA
jgi:hypothetical protein